jgi:carbamoyltransferase
MTDDQQALWGIEKLNVPRSDIPAVTHVDYSARVQTVRRETNPLFHDILSAFYARTGCPVIVNTSFNVRGEPIVCTPDDAYRCFMRTAMDVLVVGSFVFHKAAQPHQETSAAWQEEFALD